MVPSGSSAWSLAAPAFLCLVASAAGAAEEPAGAGFSGRPVALQFSAVGQGQVVAAWEAGTLAALRLKDGAVLWRHSVTGGGASLTRLLLVGGVVVGATGTEEVQAWNATSGQPLWQHRCPDGRVAELLTAGGVPGQNSGSVVLAACASQLDTLTLEGQLAWSLPDLPAVPGTLSLSASGEAACVLLEEAGGGFTSVLVGIESGQPAARQAVPGAVTQAVASGDVTVVGSRFVFVAGGKLHSYSACEGGAPNTFDLAVVETVPPRPYHVLPWRATRGIFAVTNDVFTVLFSDSAAGLRLLRVENAAGVIGPVYSREAANVDHDVAVALGRKAGYEVQIEQIGADKAVKLEKLGSSYSLAEEEDVRFVLAQKRGAENYRAVLFGGKGSLVAVRKSKVIWSHINGLQRAAASTEL